MARTYSDLITPQHRTQPKFAAWVNTLAGGLGQIYDALVALPQVFDVDTAIGVQLDAVGRWVGIGRVQETTTPPTFFSWNTPGLGWNQAYWRAPYTDATTWVTLDDATYRALIKARIGANYWRGTTAEVNAIGAEASAFLGINCTVLDNLDMSVTIYITGTPTNTLLKLIQKGRLPPKAAGVRVAAYILASTSLTPVAIPAATAPTPGLPFGSYP